MHFRLPRELRPGFRIDKGILNLYTAFPKSCTSTIEVTRAGRLLIHSAWFSPMVVVCCLLQDFCGCWPHEWWLWRTWEGALLLYQYSVGVVVMDLDGWVDGRVTSPRNGSMGSVQVGKAVFVKENYTTLGIEPRTLLLSGEIRQPL